MSANARPNSLSFDIFDEVKLDENQKFYICHLQYGHGGVVQLTDVEDELLGYERVIVGLDKERMNIDEEYAGFVLKQLLDKNRIKRLYDIAFDKIEGDKSGNYVGTVLEKENGLSILMDEDIMNKVATSPEFTTTYLNIKKLNEEYQAILDSFNNKNIKEEPEEKEDEEETTSSI